MPKGLRKCSSCGQTKNIDEYHNTLCGRHRGSGKRYRARICKACYNERKNKQQSKSPDCFLRFRYSQLKYGRKKRGEVLSFTADQLIDMYYMQGGLCALSGLQMSYNKTRDANHKRDSRRISIDRIDPDGPYEIDNIQLVCSVVNFMKGTIEQDEFVRLCKAVGAKYAEHA